jgi:glyoxylase-like metal-dependent hydrolase (beta-lactamase superfamily II)
MSSTSPRTHAPLIESFPVGLLGCNCSIIVDPETKNAIVIDPGGDFATIRAALVRLGARVTAILHTHTHIDHVGATAEVQALSGAPARIHEADRFLYTMLPVQAALVGGGVPKRADIAGDLVDEGVVRAGALELAVLHTPGHTPGSVTFLLRGGDESVAFTGDTLFRSGIGRTDLWGGDGGLILRSLRNRILALPDDVRVIAGHGPDTTIGEERVENPFLQR